mmetsp:Transcript_32185/g.59925  ORF Transcript_32185/g.59925 Transcript_32185/m.59925 type:complete len:98 (-) Transcript_32185:440-733(-)
MVIFRHEGSSQRPARGNKTLGFSCEERFSLIRCNISEGNAMGGVGDRNLNSGEASKLQRRRRSVANVTQSGGDNEVFCEQREPSRVLEARRFKSSAE